MNLGMWSDPGWSDPGWTDHEERTRIVREAGGILVRWADRRGGEMYQHPLLVREVLTPKEWRATR